jgi:hypothetical protein
MYIVSEAYTMIFGILMVENWNVLHKNGWFHENFKK